VADKRKRKIITLADGTQVKAGSAVAKRRSEKKRVLQREGAVAAARQQIQGSGNLRARVRAAQEKAKPPKAPPQRKQDPEVSQTAVTAAEEAAGDSPLDAATRRGLRKLKKRRKQ